MGQTEAIDNGHLAGPSPLRRTPRLWRGWYTATFPLDRIEPWCVVDGNPVRTEALKLPSGGTRTWGFRPLQVEGWKKDQLAPFYKELRRSINGHGVLVPVLLWRCPKGLYYVRYGASRIQACNDLAKERGRYTIPAVICDYAATPELVDAVGTLHAVNTPAQILDAFGPPADVGWLEVSHERLDAHHLEPYYKV